MSNISLREDSLLLDYYRYRVYIMPVIVFIASIILLFEVLIPQAQNWLALQDSIKTQQDKVKALNQDLGTLSGIDESGLDADIQTASSALPTQVDFLNVVAVIDQAGVNAGVSVNDYTVQSNTDSSNTQAKSGNTQSMQMSVSIVGNTNDIQKFITEIKQQLPLADITSINTSDKNVSIGLVFFYKPFPKIQFDDSQAVQQLSPSEEGLLTKLSSYQKPTSEDASTDTTISQ